MNASTPPVPTKTASAYRILHTADWHLGKLLGDKSRDEEHACFLGWLLEEVESRRVDAIILAGDVFDSANPPQSALARYYDFVSDLHKLGGCSLAVLSGNHDSATLLEAPKRVLRALDVHIAGYLEEDPKRRWLFLPDGANPRVAVALLPFLRDRDLRVGKFGESAGEIRASLTKGIQSRYAETAEAVSCGCPVLATGHLTVVGSARVATDSEQVYIPKANGKMRPLGIPNIRDRVVQAALLLILEPIFESDFLDCSHGFRPGRGAHDALEVIRENLAHGRCTVIDADMEGYFDSIPHDKLMACVRMRVVDGSVLGLIKQWLDAPVEERDGNGKIQRRRNTQGTPQGGVISPLLANIYLHWFDHVFHAKDGPAHWAKAVLVRYADDFVILARHAGEELMGFVEEKIEGWLGLKINREKTRVVNLRQEGATLDFLGFSFRRDRDLHGQNKRYWNMQPSKKSIAHEREKLRAMIGCKQSHIPLPELTGSLNRHLKGWSNYYRVGYSRRALRQINRFVRERLARHLRRRSQRGWKPSEETSVYSYLERMGLVYL